METEERLKKVLIERLRLKIAPEDIQDDAPLFGEGLGLDSIDALELAIAVEKNFGVEIKNEQEGRTAFQSIRHLAAFIEERRPR